MEIHAQALLRMGYEAVGPHGLASLGTADMHGVLTGRRFTEEVVESHHPMNFRARQVQRLGHDRNRVRGHISQCGLHRVQQLNERTGAVFHVRNDAADDFALFREH